MLENLVVFLLIAAILGGAGAKLFRDKKQGVACPSCPYSKECGVKAQDAGCGTEKE